eukprot:TRINITY_DN257_c0_g1_i1.p2 TRINITY_DN257_c0_g1~~TRINITY_DN257_c0_g1_i1.p2  ORF type:complete len:147 (+),score=36.83 TRINITY_DN257_c0_g1_i1:25-441(+)
MSAVKCYVCQKTAYPTEQIKFTAEVICHKGCFKCHECKMTLNIQSAMTLDGHIWCKTHVPVKRSATGGDSIATKSALNAPKPQALNVGGEMTAAKAGGYNPNVGGADISYADANPNTGAQQQDAAPAESYDDAPPADE